MSERTEAEAIFLQGFALSASADRLLGDGILVPEDWKFQSTEHLLPSPRRIESRVKLETLPSFIDYVSEFQDDKTKLYATINHEIGNGTILAILDDNSAAQGPAWRSHRAVYEPKFTVEWKAWMLSNAKKMSQTEFAEFIETRALDIVKPDAATMMEVSTGFQAKQKIAFSSGVKLHNGQVEFRYEEQVDGSSMKGQMKFPDTLQIGVSIFDGGAGYAVNANLRFRIKDGVLALWYDLVRPHAVIKDAFASDIKAIETRLGKRVLMGSPGG